jgi:hypothetical protein
VRPRTKSALLLAAVLALGMVLGGLITGTVVDRRLTRIEALRTSRGLAFMLEEVVRPRDEEQRSAFRALVDSATPRYAEVFESTGAELRALNDSVVAAVRPMLDENQAKRLEEYLTMRRDGRFGRRGEPGARRGEPGDRRRRPPPDGGRIRRPGEDGRAPPADRTVPDSAAGSDPTS